MKVTSIIENTSHKGLSVEHGLCLYIEKDDGQKILFDMGQSAMFVSNAETLGLSIAEIDVAVISHGHYDHGGGLPAFLKENLKAKVYIHKDAFLPHYSLRDTGLRYIGLDTAQKENERLIFCDDKSHIGNGMTLFSGVQGNCCNPVGNRLLYGPSKKQNDSFRHEQSLIIEEDNKVVLFAGCAHRGIVNILRKAEEVLGKAPTHVFAGMHLVKSGLSGKEEDAFIYTLANELKKYSHTMFYTMHCTGEEQYQKLQALMDEQIAYMACGDDITLTAQGNRCFWANPKNPLYLAYHDQEWGEPCHDERMLFEMLILEGFQAGLSWECVLNKREAFREAFDHFDVQKVAGYDMDKQCSLAANPKIIRNRLKISASIENAKAFIRIQEEFGSFDSYIWGFTNREVVMEPCDLRTTSPLSDTISRDLKKRGMKFVGSTVVYSYLQAIGIINGHLEGCYKYKKNHAVQG